MSPAPANTTTEPGRVIGPGGAIAIVVGAMLGIGIFLTPSIVASAVETPLGFFALWLVGGAIALGGGSAYAALGGILPRAGGDYVFLREGFGPSVAFAAGWLLFIGVFAGSIATTAVPICTYQVSTLLAPLGLSLETLSIDGPGGIRVGGDQLLAVGLVVFLTALNALGTRLSSRTQILLAALPVVALVFGALWALFMWGGVSEPAPQIAPASVGIGTAMAAVYFAYSGWNAVAFVGGEVSDPRRNMRVGIVGGTVLVTLVYFLLCLSYVRVLGIGGIRETGEVGSAVAAVLFGEAARPAMAGIIAVALLGSLNSCVLGGARVAQALAADGVLPSGVGRLSRSHAPARALWLQAGISVLFILTGTFEALLSLTSLAMLCLGSLTVAALFLLRRRHAEHRREAPLLWPWLPGFYVVASLGVVGVTAFESLSNDTIDLAERLLPIVGLMVFAAAWTAHAVRSARAPRAEAVRVD